ncbi:MAG: type II toxin-antitoxin system VapC family toxin [Acidobacteriota bacterium]|jgi:PIN domain nuclease of toxin-antitoxin system|nr:type II toxin-antitoxin system VapC family toxin [Acidobacteriota bacterium]
MKLLLDTHIFLWYITADSRLSTLFLDAIREPKNDVYLSVASLWEIIIKYDLGKLPLPQSPENYIPNERRRHRIKSLSMHENTVRELINLPNLHRNPFDRILICQAIANNMTIITVDNQIQNYQVSYLK